MNKIVKDALILFAITLIAGFLLGLVHEVTAEPIRTAQEQAKEETYNKVFPEAASFVSDLELEKAVSECGFEIEAQNFGSNVHVNSAEYALDSAGNRIGYLILSQAKGYGGPVEICIGISNDKKVTGIGFISISETPGLGMKAKDPEFTGQFPGKNADFLTLSKSSSGPDEVLCISGASRTSNAVTAASNAAFYFVNHIISE